MTAGAANEIRFTIHAPSEAALHARWVEAGIIEDQEGWVFKPAYDVEITATQGWDGIIEGVPGWHANAIARGVTYEAMTAGLEQYDEDGNLLPWKMRTWADYVFGLIGELSIDPESGFPFQSTTASGDIQYGDPADLSSPSNVRQ